MSDPPSGGEPAATELVRALAARGQTIAVAESLTGGAVTSALVEVPGVSAVLRGGVVAYASDLKHALLGVDAELLTGEGAVHAEVAAQMADGVRTRLAADWGVATTGVAGPDAQDDRPPGRVFVAVRGPDAALVERLDLPGGRAQVRAGSVEAVLDLLRRALEASVQPTA